MIHNINQDNTIIKEKRKSETGPFVSTRVGTNAFILHAHTEHNKTYNELEENKENKKLGFREESYDLVEEMIGPQPSALLGIS